MRNEKRIDVQYNTMEIDVFKFLKVNIHLLLIFDRKPLFFSLMMPNYPNFRMNIWFHICFQIFAKLFAKKTRRGESGKYNQMNSNTDFGLILGCLQFLLS